MKNSTKGILFLLLLLIKSSFAQVSDTVSSAQSSIILPDTTTKPSTVFIAGPPTIGLGTGMFSFFGDVGTKHFQSPMVSRIAYELIVSQDISENFQFNFDVLFGKLGADERNAGIDGTRNVNFESTIRAGSINMQYNFGHFLPKDRTASPYITLGVESFEYLSKTDAKDANGNTYYYWNDGTIRNIDQSAPNAGSAVLLKRDYTYESDIRTMNKDGFGKYSEYSFAIPLGMGAVFKINDFLNFKLGTTMHFTFTDYIDGVTFMSKGNRQGNTKYDNFMMTSCSIHYNFGTTKRAKGAIDNEERYKNIDFLALDLDDYDKDGVPDPLDSCQGTPIGVIVDAKGCPLDDDNDGVPNYKDDEVHSPSGAYVDVKGVQMSDSLIEDRYNRYMDSTMKYATIVTRTYKGNQATIDPNQKVYSVELGTFKKGLPADLMTKFLSVRDIASNNFADSTTTFTAGSFKNILDVNYRKQQLIADGFTNLKIVYKQNGKFYDVPDYTSHITNNVTAENSSTIAAEKAMVPPNVTPTAVEPVIAKPIIEPVQQPIVTKTQVEPVIASTTKNSEDNSKIAKTTTPTTKITAANNTNNSLNASGVVLRVQLGAYSKPLSKKVFKGVNNLIEIKTEDGLYKYMSGSFNSFDDAAKYKTEMILNGYPGAFITAYKDGKRVTLKEAGATPIKKEGVVLETSDNIRVSGVSKDLVKFKVQVGVFKNQPPDDKLAIFAKLTDVTGERTVSGLTRYVVGSFKSYKEADAYKNEIMKTYGISDPFVVALFNNEYISIQEALELLK
jgi:hypothetical protein